MGFNNDQVSREETEKIIESAQSSLLLIGDFVEFGCYKGDTSLMLAEIVEKSVEKNVERKLWLYDSFEGLPEKSMEDSSVLGENFRRGELFVTKREVKERFLRAGLKVPIIKKAWFSDLAEEDLPEKMAFAFIDGDFYESIRDALRLVLPRVVKGGIVIVHDYSNPALPGVKKAVDEGIRGRDLKINYYKSMIILKFV